MGAVDGEGSKQRSNTKKEGKKPSRVGALSTPPPHTPYQTKRKKLFYFTHLLTLPIPPIPLTHGLRPRVPTTTESGR